jgi:hypothetical protein
VRAELLKKSELIEERKKTLKINFKFWRTIPLRALLVSSMSQSLAWFEASCLS